MSSAKPSDPLLGNYFDRVLDVIATVGSTAIEERTIIEREAFTDLHATIRFYDRSHLCVWLRMRISRDIPLPLRYSFHYMTSSNATIFRYDNADHHQGLENSPHHKHEGADERVIDCPQPSVAQIRDEIAEYLREQKERQTTK